MNYVMYFEVIVDKVKLQDLNKYSYVHECSFGIPENNVYDLQAGPTRSVTDGYWLLLKPLSAGKHQIDFNAEISLLKDLDWSNLLDATIK